MKRRTLLGLVGAAAVAPIARAQSSGLVIFAAASLKNALDDIAAGWKDSGKPAPRISYAASSALAKQLEQGAPADLFISADIDWMDYVEKKDLIRKDTRVNLLGNKIVLIAPRDSSGAGFDLLKQLEDRKLAMANVDAVPAGKYG
ncbi:MAG: molybdate ABC transporter substrate-binding protein, partial [Rhodospirillaceae bacterium]